MRSPTGCGGWCGSRCRARSTRARGARSEAGDHLRHAPAARAAARCRRRAWSGCAAADAILHAGDFMRARGAARSSRRSGRRCTRCAATSTRPELRRGCRGARGRGRRRADRDDPRRRAGRRGGSRGCAGASPTPTRSSSATRTSRCSRRDGGFAIFNPGSPTERRRAPRAHDGPGDGRRRPDRVRARRARLSAGARLGGAHGPLALLRRHRRLGARPRGAGCPRCCCARAATGCCSTAARARSSSCCARSGCPSSTRSSSRTTTSTTGSA